MGTWMLLKTLVLFKVANCDFGARLWHFRNTDFFFETTLYFVSFAFLVEFKRNLIWGRQSALDFREINTLEKIKSFPKHYTDKE